MITNVTELDQSVEQLQRMYRALATLYRDVFPQSPSRFALLAEGPQEEISRLQQEIDHYTGRAALAELDRIASEDVETHSGEQQIEEEQREQLQIQIRRTNGD